MKEIFWNAGINNEPQLLVLPGDKIQYDEILDDMNTLLNTADIADIFSIEERSNILNKMMDTAHEVNPPIVFKREE